MNKTVVISAFPACGKTYAYNTLKKDGFSVLDSDSSKFSWCYDYNPAESDKIEKYRNPEFPTNYIKHIKENIGKTDLIFVSSHKEVRSALEKAGINYVMVYPDKKEMKAEWVGRCYLRGSGNIFCDMINKNWNEWIEEIEREDFASECRIAKCVLNRSQPYLYDIIGFAQNCIGNYK